MSDSYVIKQHCFNCKFISLYEMKREGVHEWRTNNYLEGGDKGKGKVVPVLN
jgi:hypothetical protein